MSTVNSRHIESRRDRKVIRLLCFLEMFLEENCNLLHIPDGRHAQYDAHCFAVHQHCVVG